MDNPRIAARSTRFEASCSSRNWLGTWPAWDLVHSAPGLGKGQIHLWMVDRVQLTVEDFSSAFPFSFQERKRAGAYRFRQDRNRYLIARACLRELLAGYLQLRPTEIGISPGKDGKPGLTPPNPSGVQFNLSHAGRFTLIALTIGAAIGVDIEAVNSRPGQTDLASHILSPGELEAFDALPEPIKSDRFYGLWTMKEAVLKAFGTGFTHDPRLLELGVNRVVVEVRRIEFEGASHGQWTLFQLPVAQGYKASLAVQGMGWSLDCWKMDHLGVA